MNEQQPRQLPKPVDWDELYPNRFLKAADLKGKQFTLRISKVNLEELVGDKGPQIKGVICFKETDKMVALNKTNGICLKAMFGKKVQEWVGKRITLFPTKVRMPNGDMEDAIRVHGSPDIEADMEIAIQLPRRRPTQMVMHKTLPKASNAATGSKPAAPATATASAPAATPATASPPTDIPSWQSTLNGVEDVVELEGVWQSCAQAFGGNPPLELDAAYQTRKEILGERAGRQLDL